MQNPISATCHHCGHSGESVTRWGGWSYPNGWGRGAVAIRFCADIEACCERVTARALVGVA